MYVFSCGFYLTGASNRTKEATWDKSDEELAVCVQEVNVQPPDAEKELGAWLQSVGLHPILDDMISEGFTEVTHLMDIHNTEDIRGALPNVKGTHDVMCEMTLCVR